MAAKAGVCRDFAHIGVALCRSLKIPARVVVGYLYRLDPMDMHAWFEAYVGGRWYTPDATQEQPRGGRGSWWPAAATSRTSPSCPTTGRCRWRK